MSVLILSDHDGVKLSQASRATVRAATELGLTPIDILVAGHQCRGAAEDAATIAGIGQVLLAQDESLDRISAETLCRLLRELAPGRSHILAPGGTYGKNVMPRLAALLDTQQISDISRVIAADRFERFIYAGNAVAEISSVDPIKIMTVRGTSFDAPPPAASPAPITEIAAPEPSATSRFSRMEQSDNTRPDLTAARVVISGGRGMQSGEHFAMLERIADLLGGAVGASRAAVDAGFVSNDLQVGQTGKVVAPELYIAVGISGAIQHLAGMKDSKIIVAINKDDEAPIFQVADYGLVGDLFKILPELTAQLEQALG